MGLIIPERRSVGILGDPQRPDGSRGVLFRGRRDDADEYDGDVFEKIERANDVLGVQGPTSGRPPCEMPFPDDKVTFANEPVVEDHVSEPGTQQSDLLPPDWDDPSRIWYVSPEALHEMIYGQPRITESRRPEARLPATPEQISRARSKRWIIYKDRNEAKALKGATLSGLAWAITGDGNDYELLDFKRDPRTLRVGDKVNIMPLLEKAAGKPQKDARVRKPTSLRVSEKGIQFIKSYEGLRLKPYDDKTGKTLTEWTPRATIGYGHLISKEDWKLFDKGISKGEAEKLFASDLKTKGENVVRRYVRASLSQQQYDALVALVFNVGETNFSGSTLLRRINDPKYNSDVYEDLEAAWKAFRISRGKVNQGLINRRADEWELYSRGDYRRDH